MKETQKPVVQKNIVSISERLRLKFTRRKKSKLRIAFAKRFVAKD